MIAEVPIDAGDERSHDGRCCTYAERGPEEKPAVSGSDVPEPLHCREHRSPVLGLLLVTAPSREQTGGMWFLYSGIICGLGSVFAFVNGDIALALIFLVGAVLGVYVFLCGARFPWVAAPSDRNRKT